MKSLPARGIYGWDSTNETWVKISVDGNGKVQITSTDLTTILNEIQSETYGLSAIETLVDEVESLLKNETYGLEALEALVDEIESLLKNETYGLSAIETLVDGIESDLTAMKQKDTSPAFDSDTDSLEAIREVIDTLLTESQSHPTLAEIEASNLDAAITTRAPASEYDTEMARITANVATEAKQDTIDGIVDDILVDTGTTIPGLIGTPAADLAADIAAIKTVVDAVLVDTATLPADPADESNIAADFDRHLTKWDIWSENVSVVQIPTTADQDINLSDVVVPALPTGATIWKVYLLFKCSIIRDTSGSDNGIDEAGLIRIKKDGDATFDGDGITAYNILNNAWTVDVTNVGRDRGGDAFVGKIDLSSKVDGADTYELRLDSVSADGTNLELHDVAVGLRIYFY